MEAFGNPKSALGGNGEDMQSLIVLIAAQIVFSAVDVAFIAIDFNNVAIFVVEDIGENITTGMDAKDDRKVRVNIGLFRMTIDIVVGQ